MLDLLTPRRERQNWRCNNCMVWGTAVWAVRDGPAGPRVSPTPILLSLWLFLLIKRYRLSATTVVFSTNGTRLPPNGRKTCIVMIYLLVGRTNVAMADLFSPVFIIHYCFFFPFLMIPLVPPGRRISMVLCFSCFTCVLSSSFFILPLFIYSQFYWQKCFFSQRVFMSELGESRQA